MATVVRIGHVLGRHDGSMTLQQRFRFHGVDAAAVSNVLLTAPLVGQDSIFGTRPGAEGPRTDRGRILRGFSPAPGFRFDVDLRLEDENLFVVRFAQPDRRVPYLQGSFAWLITDEHDGAVFDEQINTPGALEIVAESLTGPMRSVRRWLFFRVGHKQVMAKATSNVASLLGRS